MGYTDNKKDSRSIQRGEPIMWIRIQSRKQLVNASEFHIVERYGEFGVYAGAVVLGNYSTEEKAMKVMDMIQSRIESKIKYYKKYFEFTYGSEYVFEMPGDDDVEV